MTEERETNLELKDQRQLQAAQYVRMSTEHQKYSAENQAETIARYASERSFSIVRTYSDHGKSGLKMQGRDALQQLIRDVGNGEATFDHVLVYDISRWGRFQNADEAAYLEHLCTNAGISVHYCAEQFENDGSLTATILKSVKRAMAGEYSRELSTKVFAGQCRLISNGFRQGGMAGFGLRRQLVDEHRQPKAELRRGDRKSLQTDRVVLVPGPAEEVRIVRRMYHMFVEGQFSECEIAAKLNDEGIMSDLERSWTRGTVHQILTNEKYIGNNVYNRVSFKLKNRRVRNPPEKIIRATGVFESIVDTKIFEAARTIIEIRSRRFSDSEMLDQLSGLLNQNRDLSALVIDETEGLPSSSAYRSRFGSLLRAYSMIGYTPARDYRYIEINRFLRSLYPRLIEDTITSIEQVGGSVVPERSSDLLNVNGEFTASLVIARCTTTSAGSLRWKIRFDTGLRPDITVALRMAPDNREVRDYYLLPRLDFPGQRVRMAEENGLYLDAYRIDTLDAFFELAARSNVRRTA